MPAPVFVGNSITVKQNASGTSVAGDRPTTVAVDDLLVIHMMQRIGPSVFTPPDASWTEIPFITTAQGTSMTSRAFTKRITDPANEPLTYNFTADLSAVSTVHVFRVTGASGIDVHSSAESGVMPFVIPGFDTSGSDRLLVAFAITRNTDVLTIGDASWISQWKVGTGTGTSSRAASGSSKEQAVQGASGDVSITGGTSNSYVAQMAAIAPLVTDTTPPAIPTGLTHEIITVSD